MRAVVAAAVLAALVGCGSGVREGAVSSSTPAPTVSTSLPAAASSAIASLPNPAASNFSVPPAASTPSVGLVYVGHGVALVGVSAIGGGDQTEQPSTLWLSTDLVHWRDVTPPSARQPLEGGLFASFDQASFLNASTGWVTTWNVGNLGVTIYRTADGGKSWTTAPVGSGHGDHAGDADWIQLLSPTVAFDENVAATAPHMSLSVTTNAGTSWNEVYGRPHPDGQPAPGPFALPMLFTSRLRGFAATAIPPAEDQFDGSFFSTLDGGVSWTRMTLPAARPTTCPPDDLGSDACLFSLPAFSDSTHGVLASEVVDGAHATVGFDITADGGSTWQLTTTVDVPIPLVPADSYPKSYALVATPSGRTWWVASPSAGGVRTRVTTDAGQQWALADSKDVLGAPDQLEALDATHALLTTDLITSEGATGALYVTSDGGRSWETLFGS